MNHSIYTGVVLALIAVAAAVWFLGRLSSKRLRDGEAWRPAELRDAELVFAERDFFAEEPDRIVARVDRVYRTKSQDHFVTELKRRDYVTAFKSDQIELSVQAVALAKSERVKVNSTGYVITENSRGRRTALPVPLLTERAVGDLATRFRELLAGKRNPVRANRYAICRKCAFKERCRPAILYDPTMR